MEKKLKLAILNNNIRQLNLFIKEYNQIFNNDEFIEEDAVIKLYNKYEYLRCIHFSLPLNYKIIVAYFKQFQLYKIFQKNIHNMHNNAKIHNDTLAHTRINNFNELCGKIEGKELDLQQKDAVVRIYNNQLVIAGAGSGKTTVIIGKVKYLIKNNYAKANEILVLSFTNATATEMRQRLYKEIGKNIDVFTFHKLGVNILEKASSSVPKIYDKDLLDFVEKQLIKLSTIDIYLEILIDFISDGRYKENDYNMFNNPEEYQNYLQYNPPTTLKGERVKSYGEMEIANFLFKNNINYYYEPNYKYNNNMKTNPKYKPDFYLPEYNIYIEYFGIDENGNVPSFFKSDNEISAKDKYMNSIIWKRKTHELNHTNLIECYAYEKKKNLLIKNLKAHLKEYKVNFKPKTEKEIWQAIQNNNTGIFHEVAKPLTTIINLIKNNNYTFNDVLLLNQKSDNFQNNMLALALVRPIYDIYNQYLLDNNQIDFNDMINKAIMYLKLNKYQHNYKYVIVDEYQDISKSRYNLLVALRKNNYYKLFCVGDDWQSIYKFSGSDISLITDFVKYWGKTFFNKIEKTYRFSSEVAKISGNFIMQNERQIKKNINGNGDENSYIKIIERNSDEDLIYALQEQLMQLDDNTSVFLLGRYSFDIDILKNNKHFAFKYDNTKQLQKVVFVDKPSLKINFLTIHKAKGLQADYVILLNNKNEIKGFPSKITDIAAIDLLLENSDRFPYSEERRLFYVAITRARKGTILFVNKNNKSCFIKEIESSI